MKKKIVAPFLLFLLVGCSSHHDEHEHVEKVQVDEVPQDFVLPQVVWDSMKSQNPGEKDKPIVYSSLVVNFKEKNHGVLKSHQLAYDFPRGGGEIDLSQVVGDHDGSYFLNFETPEFDAATKKKVFFVSQSRQRKVDGEILGSGCNKVLDVSTSFLKQIKKEGLKMNTTRHRHDSVMGGHLVFIAETEKNWLLSQVTFFDSTRTDLFCKGFRSGEVQ